MKKIIILFAVILLISTCSTQQQTYSINGKIEGLTTGKIVMLKYGPGYEKIKVDSADIKDELFTFKGQLQYPHYFHFIINGKRAFGCFIENADIQVDANVENLRNVKVTGCPSQEKYEAFSSDMKNLERDLEERKADFDIANKLIKEQQMKFISDNKNTIVAAYVASRELIHYATTEELEFITNSFDKDIGGSFYVSELKKHIEILKKTAIGQSAIDFTMSDPDGNAVSLSSFREKYLLIDFWASWCRPCREENPNVVAMYHKYHEKGFDVLGVSFDSDKEKWLQAIKDDGLSWTHVSDLKGWQNAAGQLYAIRSIPSSLLLDKENIIIAKNLRGEHLQEKLAELFD